MHKSPQQQSCELLAGSRAGERLDPHLSAQGRSFPAWVRNARFSCRRVPASGVSAGGGSSAQTTRTPVGGPPGGAPTPAICRAPRRPSLGVRSAPDSRVVLLPHGSLLNSYLPPSQPRPPGPPPQAVGLASGPCVLNLVELAPRVCPLPETPSGNLDKHKRHSRRWGVG